MPYCVHCGSDLPKEPHFCEKCGKPVAGTVIPPPKSPVRRNMAVKVLVLTCVGLFALSLVNKAIHTYRYSTDHGYAGEYDAKKKKADEEAQRKKLVAEQKREQEAQRKKAELLEEFRRDLAAEQKRHDARRPRPQGGQSRLRRAGGSGEVAVAIDERALDAAISASNARDGVAFGSLVAQGRLFIVASDTSVQVIGSGFGKLKIRVLEGSEAGRGGWVPAEWVAR